MSKIILKEVVTDKYYCPGQGDIVLIRASNRLPDVLECYIVGALDDNLHVLISLSDGNYFDAPCEQDQILNLLKEDNCWEIVKIIKENNAIIEISEETVTHTAKDFGNLFVL